MAAQGLLTTRRLLLAGTGALALPPWRPARGQTPAQPAWPHTVAGPGGSATIYQPQVISWPGQAALNARAAVAVNRPGTSRPVPGTLEVTARTTTDMATRTVALTDLRLVGSRFPSLDTGQAAQREARLRAALPAVASRTVPLDTVLLSLRNAADAPPDDPAVNNDPPAIFHSARPASLVVFDDEPVLVRIPDSPLSIAVNTNWPVLSDAEGGWWLLNNGGWMTAPRAASLDGPWRFATPGLPPDFAQIPPDSAAGSVLPAVPGTAQVWRGRRLLRLQPADRRLCAWQRGLGAGWRRRACQRLQPGHRPLGQHQPELEPVFALRIEHGQRPEPDGEHGKRRECPRRGRGLRLLDGQGGCRRARRRRLPSPLMPCRACPPSPARRDRRGLALRERSPIYGLRKTPSLNVQDSPAATGSIASARGLRHGRRQPESQ